MSRPALPGLSSSGVAAEAAVIAPYQALAEAVAAAAGTLGLPLIVRVGDLAEGVRLAKGLWESGVKVFISRGGTAALLRENGLTVAEVDVSACDILEALKSLGPLAEGSPIGLIGFENILAGAHRLAGLLAIDLRVSVIRRESEAPEKLKALKRAGVRAVLGDRVVAGQAAAFGLQAALIQSGPDAVEAAVREAGERLRLLNWAAAQNQGRLEALSQFKTVLDALEDPALILDRDGRIINFNQAAAALPGAGGGFDWTAQNAFARALKSGRPQLDQLAELAGRRFLVDFRPIQRAAGETAAESTMIAVMARSAEKVETSERRLRQGIYLKGHVARYRLGDIITEDEAFQALLEKAAEYARSDSSIVIQGESGSGKEMLAQSIHNLKFKSAAPFVAINCASLPAGILESELFGYAPGAFTGALKEGKKGYFELAHGGTLFLDEVGEMPLELQSRLLRAIEEKAILPVGADRLIPVKVRLLAAANVDLAEAVRQGRFRKDLYFRLGVLFLSVPPLRLRGRDPLVLFRRLVGRFNPGLDQAFPDDPALSRAILAHTWPGNAREIKNLAERLAITTRGFTRRLDEMAALVEEELAGARRMSGAPPPEEPEAASEAARLDALREALRFKGKAALARELGISRATLWRRLKAAGADF